MRTPPICEACVHRIPEFGAPRCTAFPDGIPDQILGGFDHREPFKGDQGIRFELDPNETAILALYEDQTKR